MKEIIVALLVFLNGQAISFQGAQPINDRGVVLVPARGVFQAMGASVDYNPVTRDVVARIGETKIEMAIGRMHAWVNGREVELPQPVRLQNGSVFIPARFVSEAFGAKVRWDKPKSRVLISYNANRPKPSTPLPTAPIEVKFQSDKRNYKSGETVMFTLVARNTGNQEQVLNFTSGQSFDISVTPTNQDRELWRWDWSFGRFFTQALRSKTLKPNQTISLSAMWDQTDNSGKPMPRAEYSVDAKIVANNEIEAPALTIRLSE